LLAVLQQPGRAQARLKVAGLYTVPVEQQWVSRIHVALMAAAARGDIDYSFTQGVKPADFEKALAGLAERGHELIVGESFAAEAAARKVARRFPKVAFLMGSAGKPQRPNFSVFDNYIQDAAYLSGMVAGGMTSSDVIGLVAGVPVPETNRLMNAFMAGARETNAKARFMVTFLETSFDPPRARDAAIAMMNAGADVLYAERFGVSDAARERKVLTIGNVTDTQATYPDTVVVSALWHMEPTIERAVQAVKAGEFKAADYGVYSLMKFKGSSLSPLGTFEGKVPAEVMAKVRARERTLAAGTFTVRVDDRRPATPRR
jgi:basic membrane lipoprotein Med (substrate-binding protein (PBP1-ABC) superfamily)